jgi:hypothetical protein
VARRENSSAAAGRLRSSLQEIDSTSLTAAIVNEGGQSFRSETDDGAGGDIERPMFAFGDAGKTNRGGSGPGGSDGLREMPGKGAGGGDRAGGVTGRERLFLLVTGTAGVGVIVAMVEEDMRARAVDKTFHNALTQIGGRDRGEHSQRAISHAPVAGPDSNDQDPGRERIEWPLVSELARAGGSFDDGMMPLARDLFSELDIGLLDIGRH